MLSRDFPTAKNEHNYHMRDDCIYECKNCNHTVKRLGHGGVCIGIPIYEKWDDIPDTVATKTTLSKEHGLKPAKDQYPTGAKKQFKRNGTFTGHYYPLYAIADAEPKKKATEAQLEALEKARYMAEKVFIDCSKCGRSIEGDYDFYSVTRKTYLSDKERYDNYVCEFCDDKEQPIQWAKDILSQDNIVILDTETTGLDGEIVEIAIIDLQGNIILDQRIKPLGEMYPRAEEVHGISLDMLADKPSFKDVYPLIKKAVQGKKVIIYNAQFDIGILQSDCVANGLDEIKFKSDCAMLWYAQYYGDWNHYYKSYRWQPLNGTHGALGDCIATLELIKSMTESEAA